MNSAFVQSTMTHDARRDRRFLVRVTVVLRHNHFRRERYCFAPLSTGLHISLVKNRSAEASRRILPAIDDNKKRLTLGGCETNQVCSRKCLIWQVQLKRRFWKSNTRHRW